MNCLLSDPVFIRKIRVVRVPLLREPDRRRGNRYQGMINPCRRHRGAVPGRSPEGCPPCPARRRRRCRSARRRSGGTRSAPCANSASQRPGRTALQGRQPAHREREERTTCSVLATRNRFEMGTTSLTWAGTGRSKAAVHVANSSDHSSHGRGAAATAGRRSGSAPCRAVLGERVSARSVAKTVSHGVTPIRTATSTYAAEPSRSQPSSWAWSLSCWPRARGDDEEARSRRRAARSCRPRASRTGRRGRRPPGRGPSAS